MDLRRTSIYLGRSRFFMGLLLLLAPGAGLRAWGARGPVGPFGSLNGRIVGLRDMALGAGTSIAASERNGGAGWMSIAALSDIGDGAVCLLTPGLARRTRVIGIGALALGVYGFAVSTKLAAEELAVGESAAPNPAAPA